MISNQAGQYGYASTPNTVYAGSLSGTLLSGAPYNATLGQCQYWCTSPNNAGTAYATCVAWYYSGGVCYYYSSAQSGNPFI
jgi:hypothetical protein